MRRGELFWGSLLVILGILFFLQAAGYLTGDVFGWFWPILIVALGIWVLAGGFGRRTRFASAEKFSVPLQGAREASLEIEQGAGRLEVRSGANPGDFLTGITGAAMNHTEHLEGEKLAVRLEAGPTFIPMIGPEGGLWEYRLSGEIPISISLRSGASGLDLDLTDLRVTRLMFEGGASRLRLKLPSRVENAVVEIRAGAARIDLEVPRGVSLRFRGRTVGSLQVDESRFPRSETGLYQSAGYDAAPCKADVTVDGGATSVRIY